MSADKCPSCGCVKWGDGCEDAFRISAERSAEIERLKAMLEHKWTDRRAFQLTSDLAGLLRECHDLNTASGVIGRMERIVSLAGHILIADIANGEPSFLEFLNQLCRDDRRNQSNQEK